MEQSDVHKLNIVTDEVQKAADVVDNAYTYDKDGYTTSTGVRLKYKKVPSQMVYKAWAGLEQPKVPEYYNEDYGRSEPNPMAPSYIEAVALYHHKRTHLTTYLYFMRGIDVIDYPRDEVVGPESDEWYAGLEEELGIKPDMKPIHRQTLWLMYYAIPDDVEQNKVLTDLMIKSGFIPEPQVQEILDSFRDTEGESSDKGTSGTEGNTD